MPLILAGHTVIIPSRLCSKREFSLTKSDKSVSLRCSTTPNSSEKKHQELNLGAHRADHLQGIGSIATDRASQVGWKHSSKRHARLLLNCYVAKTFPTPTCTVLISKQLENGQI